MHHCGGKEGADWGQISLITPFRDRQCHKVGRCPEERPMRDVGVMMGSAAIDKMEVDHVNVREDAAEHSRRHDPRSAGPAVSCEITEYVASRKMSDQHRQTSFIAESVEHRGILWRIQEGLPRFAPGGLGRAYFALGGLYGPPGTPQPQAGIGSVSGSQVSPRLEFIFASRDPHST